MKNKTAGWFFFAEKDMLMAKTAIDYAELTGGVAFHCQQAIEKYFKAYLAQHDREIRKIHDLLKLYSEVKEIRDWGLDEDLLEDISKVYAESRYPGNIGIKPDGLLPTTEDAQRYLEFAQKVEAVFKVLVESPTSPA
ncbi:MAG: HEPN domain-containing protein [Chitinispirillales bacterium]|jgi:HEPN domain-containing protein|nr:HEPN domain-containing protein [Chitinispirillales bacterium]